MAIVKSKLLKQLSKNYPNFLKKDLEKFTDIILKEIKLTLKRGERVELRGFGIFSTNIQKARISRNPKTGEKVNTPEKRTIHFKMAKDLFKKLNNDE
ncbi:HU family DNA-binding protein [Candidatus Pelagibacter communis]|uniref:HU family DNA-binding protein n=1 Tax=Pelagibacter ubique TaxID=198252 RepID=UPI00094BEE2C|nr:HU family DNA-binding protein [Candidatus Pelagibacter ubique]